MPQAKRPEIEELLTLLFDEIEPKDERVGQYGKRIETRLKKRLKCRKNILKQPWFKKRIQVAFDASQKRLQQNNAHVTTCLCVNSFYELNIPITETACSDDAASDDVRRFGRSSFYRNRNRYFERCTISSEAEKERE